MKKAYLFLIILTLYSLNIYSQSDTNNLRKKIEKIKLEKLTNKLGLDQNTENTFIEKYKDYIQDNRELIRKRNQLMRKIEQNLDNENELDSMLSLLLSYENDIITRKSLFFHDLKTFLSAKQIATLFVFERRFASEMRKLLREQRRERRNHSK